MFGASGGKNVEKVWTENLWDRGVGHFARSQISSDGAVRAICQSPQTFPQLVEKCYL